MGIGHRLGERSMIHRPFVVLQNGVGTLKVPCDNILIMKLQTFAALPLLWLSMSCNGSQSVSMDGTPTDASNVEIPADCDLSETRVLATDDPIAANSYCDQISFCVESSLRETVHTVTGAVCEVDAHPSCGNDVICTWEGTKDMDQAEMDAICALTKTTPKPHQISCDMFLP